MSEIFEMIHISHGQDLNRVVEAPEQSNRRDPPLRPASFTWPLIIALSACGGGGGGSQKQPAVISVDKSRDPDTSVPSPKILNREIPYQTAIENLQFSQKLPDFSTFLHITKAQAALVTVEAVRLPSGMALVNRDGAYFIEGKVPLPGLLTYELRFNWPGDSSTRLIQLKIIEHVPDLEVSGREFRNTSIGNRLTGPESENPDLAPTAPNQAPIILSRIPDVTVHKEPLTRLKVNMDQYFRDPEGRPLFYKVTPLPDGLIMQHVGPFLYGRPKAEGTFTLTVTASEYEREDVAGPALSNFQIFRLHVLHREARILTEETRQDEGEQSYNAMLGSPVHQDVFDITAENDGQPEKIENFDPRFDRIFIGANQQHVALEAVDGAAGSYRLHAYDQDSRQKGAHLATISTAGGETLSAEDLAVIFEPHDLDSSFPDIEVHATIL